MVSMTTRLLYAVIIAVLCSTTMARGQERTVLTFLHFNDTYLISPNPKGLGGFAPLRTLLKQEIANARGPTFITFGGDAISPTALSGVTKGAHMIELLNAVGTAVAVPGNHEFDFGPEVLQARVQESHFPWLAPDVVRKSDGKICCGMQEHMLVNMGGIKVGMFGLLTKETEGYSSMGPNTIKPYKEVAEQQVRALRDQGAEVIVAVTHLGFQEDISLGKVKGIHLVLGGHEHVVLAYYGNDVDDLLVLKVGQDGEHLGVVELPVERGERGVTVGVPTWKVLPVQGIQPDQEVQSIVSKYAKQEQDFKVVIGKTSVPINAIEALMSGKETALGNVIADAMRQATKADVALIHGFNFRGMKKGVGEPLTHLDILEALPFANTVVVVELTGAQLRAALEHGVSGIRATNPRELSRFLQVSGLRLTYDPARPARHSACPPRVKGSRITQVSVADAPLDDKRKYRVAINNFMAEGGNGYCMFLNAPRVSAPGLSRLLTDMTVEYIKQSGAVSAQPVRITGASGK